VQTSDLFDTALALAGVLPSEADALVGAAPHVRYSESFLPYLADPARPSIRELAYTEKFIPNGPPPWNIHEVALRDERWKLIRHEQLGIATHELYDLWADPWEADDLLLADPLEEEHEAASERLMSALADLEVALPFDY
jgi:arylsulfatase A-like enzyme